MITDVPNLPDPMDTKDMGPYLRKRRVTGRIQQVTGLIPRGEGHMAKTALSGDETRRRVLKRQHLRRFRMWVQEALPDMPDDQWKELVKWKQEYLTEPRKCARPKGRS
jgi:hypothetical protein